ncbi:DNA polymerase III subunit gamma/tau [Bremerella alba]|uniref:DNA polymerase III subunit gamma/tau n=1 Tax=Bremerella alba TaxID=980252 RepID=A0A7V9A8U0_9BACT|nr:DNA polymerase III subunit gamma/tau [Bremerella alba]MBA2116767.1 Holliday junction ATP-dependent DNA helicase RuvB [Bremerella alba]
MAEQNSSPDYLVVARRYRPQSFGELVGQQRVATALGNAIERNRVGHAYLFTGARGVGKTSSARIFAKALNCAKGPTATPCNECEICESVTAGEDVDVLEIDGASNRGIEEIRQLRANINVRPSRARFKIYIIDEVHMFTKEAFNALLKTLEEPPEHAKFIFCTTDPERIPITVLSRCQRFDFGGILPEDIVGRLRHIVDTEQVPADDEALKLIARRANGSMRDSQSLLEQILAFGDSEITVESVHRLLGTADNQQIIDLAGQVLSSDAANALQTVHSVFTEGVDPGQLLEQLLRLFRDLMVLGSGGSPDLLQTISPGAVDQAKGMATQAGVAKLLAAVQCLDETLVRLHRSTYGQVLAEAAVIRICQLDDLESLGSLIATLKEGGVPAKSAPTAAQGAAPQKKTAEHPVERPPAPDTIPIRPVEPPPTPPSMPAPAPSDSPAPTDPIPAPKLVITEKNVLSVWRNIVEDLPGLTADFARKGHAVAISGPNRLVVDFFSTYNSAVEALRRPKSQEVLEKAFREMCGDTYAIDFRVLEDPNAARKADSHMTPERSAQEGRLKARLLAEQEPFVQKAMDLFDGEVTGVRDPDA